MTKVCVIGGGTSGSAAAEEAASRGAQVTVIESRAEPDPPWRSWIDLARPTRSEATVPRRAPGRGRGWNVLSSEARSVDGGRVRTADGNTVEADQVVAATGCGFAPVVFPGCRKAGVLVLDTMKNYLELRELRARSRRLIVCGEGYRSLAVAESQLGDGMKVGVIVTSWQSEMPSQPAMTIIEDAAEARGVSLLKGSIGRAVGSASVEAVVVDGRVVPCDALVVVPRRVPRGPSHLACHGPLGGFSVDCTLRTESGAYAAGGCAELSTATATFTLEDAPGMTGRIAGANCTGERFAVRPGRSRTESLFGLIWSRTGLGPAEARASGIECGTTSYQRDDLAACTITYEKVSGKVVGAEWVDGGRSSYLGVPPLSSGLTLGMLAYWSSGGSSDISLVSETARLGLSGWRKY